MTARTAYHRLARESPEHRWWRLPAGLGIGVVAYFGLTVVVIVHLAIGTAAGDRFQMFEDFLDSPDLELDDPWFLGISLLLVALMLPAIQIGRLIGPHDRFGELWSVDGRLRWRWLGLCSLLAAVVYTVVIVAALVLDDARVTVHVDGAAVTAVVIVFATVPLQATAEEAVFRGHLMQMFASWTRWTVIPIVLSTALFVAGHTYDLWGLVDVGIFGVTAAILAIRTGGLEAPIAAHAANNIVLMVAESVSDVWVTTVDYGPVDLLPTVVSSALMIGGCELLMRWTGTHRTRERLPDPPPRRKKAKGTGLAVPPPPPPTVWMPPPPPPTWPPPPPPSPPRW